jgi:hypothetical protein
MFRMSSVGIFFIDKQLRRYNSKKLRRCCHVDMTAKGGCVSRVGVSGSEGDTGTAGNSGKNIPLSLSCQRGNTAVIFTIDNVKSVAP